MLESNKDDGKEEREEETQSKRRKTDWESKAVRDACSSLHFLSCLHDRLLLLLLSVCDDVADVLVVNIASNIWGEGGPQILHLMDEEQQRIRIE